MESFDEITNAIDALEALVEKLTSRRDFMNKIVEARQEIDNARDAIEDAYSALDNLVE